MGRCPRRTGRGHRVQVHRAPLPRGLADAAAGALADAFAGEPSAIGSDARPSARRLLMRVPVDACARAGGLVVAREGGAVVGAAAWLPGDRRGGGVGHVWTSGSWRLLPLLGVRGLRAVLREAAETDRLVSRYVSPDDAYLWIVGVVPAAHGRGLGGALVRAVVEDARAAGHGRLVLVTHNPANVPVYRALGLHVVDDTARSRGHVLHVMARTL